MEAVRCLVANAAEAGELAPVLEALRNAGAMLRVAAPEAAVASIEALGVRVDDALDERADALEGLLSTTTQATLLLSPTSALARSAARCAHQCGATLVFASGSAPGPGLALEDLVEAAKCGIEEVAPEEALRLLEAPGTEGWHFVDVREPDEYAAGHLPGARSSPRGFLEVRADLEHYKRDPWFEDRDRPMIVYCGGGHRSALAVATLQRMGFTRLLSLAEGYTGWIERSYPVTPPTP